MDGKKSRKEKKEIIKYIEEQIAYLEDAFEPSILKSLEHVKDKFGLDEINYKYRIQWKMTVGYDK